MRHPARRTATRLVTASAAIGLIASLTSGPAAADPQNDALTPPVAAGGEVVPMNYAINAFEVRDGDWDERSYQKSTRAVKRAVRAEGGELLRSFPKIGVVIARATDASFVDAMRSAEHEDIVESIGATRTSPTTIPNDGRAPRDIMLSPDLEPDPLEGDQWGNEELNSLAANEIEPGSPDVLVGILDSGVDHDHPDLAAAIDPAASVDCTNNGIEETDPAEWQATNGSHGTHVAGTVVAQRNGIGVAGIAPGVKIGSVKVVNPDGFIFPEYAICGFMWATHKDMDVTNNSYYIDPWLFWCPEDEDQGAVLEAVGRALDWSSHKGTVNVAAAGNANTDLANKTTDSSSPNDSTPIEDRPVDGCFDIPTEHDGVVTVASTTESDQRSSFSNYGFEVIDVSAPGSDILSTVVGGGYSFFSGTSMASPHVSGVLALLASANPDATPAELVEILEDTAEDRACGGATGCVGDAGYNGFFGHGVVDALAAVS